MHRQARSWLFIVALVGSTTDLAQAQLTPRAADTIVPSIELGLPGDGPDQTPPRIISFSPAPGALVVDNIGLAEVQIGFDEPVVVPDDAIIIWTVGGGTVSDFSTAYDMSTDVLTICFATPPRDDRVTIVVDYTVTDPAGNQLDGEIFDPENAILPSGDLVRGGQAVFRVNVLQGDANRNGVVDSLDGEIISASLGLCEADPEFDPNADLNGDSCVNVLDVGIFTTNEGQELPAVDGVPPNVVAINAPDPTIVVLSFNESIAPKRFNSRSCFLVDEARALAVPSSASLARDGLSATYYSGTDHLNRYYSDCLRIRDDETTDVFTCYVSE